jgi:hypothetical protein
MCIIHSLCPWPIGHSGKLFNRLDMRMKKLTSELMGLKSHRVDFPVDLYYKKPCEVVDGFCDLDLGSFNVS